MARRGEVLAGLCLCGAVLCAGCGRAAAPPIGYFVESSRCLDNVRRVVLVDLRADRGGEPNAGGMTEALAKGLQGSHVFHVERLPQTHPALRDLALNKRTPLSFEEVRTMQEQLQSDAVLFGAVTQFTTHPRLETGLLLRLLDLRKGTIIWAVDYTWDTTEKQTEDRMKRWFETTMRREYEPASWRMARMSPATFRKFIAHEVVATLPTPADARAPGP